MSKFGTTFAPKDKFYLPFQIISSKIPIGINYISGVSAQLKSAVIFAALNSFGNTNVIEKNKSRDHTEKMLSQNKKVIKIKMGNQIQIKGKDNLKSIKIKVGGDPSSAAFFCALALLKKNSSLKILNVGLNPRRIGFYQLLKKYGANIKFKNLKRNNNEVVGDIFVKYSKLNL